MRTLIALLTLLTSTLVASSAEKPLDLTGAGPDAFKANLGKVVTLRGRLEQGMQGPSLFGATSTNIVFYVIPDIPPSGTYTYPASWERLMHKQVSLTGELKFRSFDRTNQDPLTQRPPDYFYMVLQRTQIKGTDSK
jgi:hypothetical protein